eukprot:2534136-Pyramimonas_sp.AAC.1
MCDSASTSTVFHGTPVMSLISVALVKLSLVRTMGSFLTVLTPSPSAGNSWLCTLRAGPPGPELDAGAAAAEDIAGSMWPRRY